MIGNFRVNPDAPAGHFVKGFATIDDVSLINVEVLRPLALSVAALQPFLYLLPLRLK